jgi:4-diphosphocytidyl-2-C-methyl-D-erythritol kinase
MYVTDRPRVVEQAPAKVNLFLHVTGRRPDGYHLLDSLAVFTAMADVVTAEASDGFSLGLTGPFGQALETEADNLVVRAARMLAREAGLRLDVKLTLTKNLPIASGIGGGSADAAATLRALNRLWDLRLDHALLHGIASGLGADVPVCLMRGAARMAGIGDQLAPAPKLPACGLVLINPGVSVPTPAVFKAYRQPFTPPASLPDGWSDVRQMADDLARLHNDLAPPAISLQPSIADVLAFLQRSPNCLLARMSGSGATCFGLFATTTEAAEAAARCDQPGWWRWGGGLFDG